MISVASFTFNGFAENTYLLIAPDGDCLVIDPGMYELNERKQFSAYCQQQALRPIRLLNTHCHIDHIMGNAYVAEKYGLYLEAHELEVPVLAAGERVAQTYGLSGYLPSPPIEQFIQAGDVITLGDSQLLVLFAPGHSPGSICFYAEQEGFVIAGDVLFRNSIGRTDLPGGHHATLIESIYAQLLTLPDNTKVYPGHGTPTTIGYERKYNPFLVKA